MNRNELAYLICNQLTKNRVVLKNQFLKSKATIGYFFIDDLFE